MEEEGNREEEEETPQPPPKRRRRDGDAEDEGEGSQQKKTDDKPRPRGCPIDGCPRRYPLAELREHLDRRHHDTLLCSHCLKVFENQYEASRHFREHQHLQRNLTCLACFHSFTTRQDLMTHIEDRHEGEPSAFYPCEDGTCTAVFGRKRDLPRHMREKHGTQNRYMCGHSTCTKTVDFGTSRLIKDHIRKKHRTTQYQYAKQDAAGNALPNTP